MNIFSAVCSSIPIILYILKSLESVSTSTSSYSPFNPFILDGELNPVGKNSFLFVDIGYSLLLTVLTKGIDQISFSYYRSIIP